MKISKLVVACPEGVVFKKIDFNQDELDKVVKLECAAKVKPVALINGVPDTTITNEFDWKFLHNKRGIDKIEIYGQSKAPFKILFGFGGYPYEERKTSLKTNLGFTGSCTLEVVSFKELLNYFPSTDELTEESASSAFRTGICDVVKSVIGDELSRLKKSEVEPTLMELKEKDGPKGLNNRLRDFFAAKGLALKEFTIKVNFPSDFLDKYQEFADKEAETKQFKKEMDIMKDIVK